MAIKQIVWKKLHYKRNRNMKNAIEITQTQPTEDVLRDMITGNQAVVRRWHACR